ncbi:leucine--tRNA ligase [Candidatus Adlerbacteria bacterium RIFCSPHIGHO2_02_FULL_54_18]|uniref:Leucine--tRNA ligase n=1 Tax=Candidatus Adlerbacteria bacterium RIFCSPHIGHO2_02_FULL_54_18 TaxID=1797241 RepID=A0A1F4Y1K9_9BACT|nr:MAG: leucine--tRNA ligase [Candidatus Adlerbacteria bacterium RIFCSPHIGHO2_02_FULL_54_18]
MAQMYNPKEIERKWQDRWEKSAAFTAEDNSQKPKQYILDMFPYPSGEGLHVGHVEGYTATDIYSRYKRMKGFNVLHPMGWDAFGLPAENYAIKTSVAPQETTDKSINNFRRQIKALGFSYDWSREVGTHNPDYYRWTQWLFTKFFEKGLVYKKKALVNWDPVDQTVLANEQVLPDGTAERSGAKVEKKDLEQWFFKITDYANELEDSLEQLDWPESTKINQRNWIGRSEGAELEFKIDGHQVSIKVFTTRSDTLFGATYLVLAPEHPELLNLKLQITNWDEVETYINEAKNKSDIDRSADGKEKTGVELKGIMAINPANKEEMPVWVADYVLGHYGTGAIMAVPAHDERDYEFAQRFGLPVRQVLEPFYTQETEPGKVKKDMPYDHRNAIIAVVKHWSEDKYIALKWKQVAWVTFVTGGIEEGQTAEEAAKMEIEQETGYTSAELVEDYGLIHGLFYHVPKKVNRVAHAQALLFALKNDSRQEVSAEELEKHEVLWLSAEELKRQLTPGTHQHTLRLMLGTQGPYIGPGILNNSGTFDGMQSEEAKQKITEFVGGKTKTTYRLRDWLISRQRYWGAPIPIVYDPEGKAHSIPEEHLPWMLPTDVEFKPTGTSPLGQSKELLERTERIFGKGWRPEIDTMDTFVCSSWYFLRFADAHNKKEFASKEELNKWLPVDLYVGGAEHTVLHLLYGRFFTKALHDMGYLAFDEPFLRLRHQGLILAVDGNKMSKSKGNVVNPDDIIVEYGADILRLYMMFMGPLEQMKPWNTQNIAGVQRFLERVWRLGTTLRTNEPKLEAKSSSQEALLHRTIKKVGDDIESLKMNTAVSALMILLNECEKEEVSSDTYKIFLQLLAPFAPHIVHELAEKNGVDLAKWPAYDESKLVAKTLIIGVQVDGKLRGSIELAVDAPQAEALAAARVHPAVAKWLNKGEKKVFYVPGKIVSFSTV